MNHGNHQIIYCIHLQYCMCFFICTQTWKWRMMNLQSDMSRKEEQYVFFWQISFDRTYRSTPYARLLILQCVWKNAMHLEFGHQSPKSTNHLLYLPLVIVSVFLHTNMEVKNYEHTIQCVLKRRAEYVFLFLWTTIFG